MSYDQQQAVMDYEMRLAERRRRRAEVSSKPYGELTADDKAFAFREGIDVGSGIDEHVLRARQAADRPGLEGGVDFWVLRSREHGPDLIEP